MTKWELHFNIHISDIWNWYSLALCICICDLYIGNLENQQKEPEQINNLLLQQIKLHSAKLVDLQSLPQGNDVRLEGLSEETKMKTGMKKVRWLVEWMGPERFV